MTKGKGQAEGKYRYTLSQGKGVTTLTISPKDHLAVKLVAQRYGYSVIEATHRILEKGIEWFQEQESQLQETPQSDPSE